MSRGVCLFDLDGTLTDPREGIFGCIRHAFEVLGRPAPAEAALSDWVGPPLMESFTRALSGCEATAARALSAYRERFDRVGWRENRLIPEIDKALRGFSEAGVRCAVVTSKPQVFARRIVEHFGLDRWMDEVFGSELDGTRTGKSELIGWCLEALAVDPAGSVMIGDRRQDIAGARACGIESVGVLWGFGSRAELLAAGADHIATRPAELKGLCRC